MYGGVLLGDWTHRRRDAGGTRSLTGDLSRSKPRLVWTWAPSDGSYVDQVRIANGSVYVATSPFQGVDEIPWQPGSVHCLELESGRTIASRRLADPAPVCAMVLDHGLLYVIGSQPSEPIFVYGLTVSELRPVFRRRVTFSHPMEAHDVVDAWALPAGGLWLELHGEESGQRHYCTVVGAYHGSVVASRLQGIAASSASHPRDACVEGHRLYGPALSQEISAASLPSPVVWRVSPGFSSSEGETDENAPMEVKPWVQFPSFGLETSGHSVIADGVLGAIAVGRDPARDDRAVVQAMAVDRHSGVVRWSSEVTGMATFGPFGESARLGRRNSGELLFQKLGSDGVACSDLIRFRTDGATEEIQMGGRRRFVFDVAVGDLIVGHHEDDSGRTTVAALAIDRTGRFLGGRAQAVWSIEVPDVGGSVTIYASDGHILVRGSSSIVAIRV